MSKIKEQYREVSGGVTERTRVLNKLTEELDQIKKEMDERGSSMTDGSKFLITKYEFTCELKLLFDFVIFSSSYKY